MGKTATALKPTSWRTLNRMASQTKDRHLAYSLRKKAAMMRREERAAAKRKTARKTQTASIVAMRRAKKASRTAVNLKAVHRKKSKSVSVARRARKTPAAAVSASVETAQALNAALYGDTSGGEMRALRALSPAERLLQQIDAINGGGKIDFEHPTTIAAIAEIEKFGLDKAERAKHIAEQEARTLKRVELVSHFLAMVSAINLMNHDKGVATVVADNEIEAIVKSLRLAGYSEHGYFPDGRQAMDSDVMRRAS